MLKSKFIKVVTGVVTIGAFYGSFVQAQSLCPGQEIPYNKSNQISSVKITCNIGSQKRPHLRVPVEIPKDQWFDWKDTKDNQSREAAQQMRLNDAAPSWQSSLPVEVYQEWNWVSVYSEQNEAICGSHYVDNWVDVADQEYYCEPEPTYPSSGASSGSSGGNSGKKPFKYESSQSGQMNKSERAGGFESRAKSGNKSGGWKSGSGSSRPSKSRRKIASSGNCYYRNKGTYHKENKPIKVIHTCPVPHTIHERQFCKNNQLPYTVHYKKPDITKYSPSTPGYFDALPNKYDLLPGEWEKIHVKGETTSGGQRLGMKVEIENEWNYYSGKDTQTVRCTVEELLPLNFEIVTESRRTRKAPKVLSEPIDEDGQKQPAIVRNLIVKNGEDVKTAPYKLMLQDASASMIRSMAEDGRNFGSDQDAQSNLTALNGGGKVMSFRQSPFWKDTRFRVKLYQKGSLLGRAIRMSQPLRTDSSKVVSATDLSLIEIPLDEGDNNIYKASGPGEKWFGWLWARIPVRLTPGTDFEFRVSSYQNGIPFYEGGCKNDDDPYCSHDEFKDAAFSEELILPFSTDARYDERSWINKLFDMPR